MGYLFNYYSTPHPLYTTGYTKRETVITYSLSWESNDDLVNLTRTIFFNVNSRIHINQRDTGAKIQLGSKLSSTTKIMNEITVTRQGTTRTCFMLLILTLL
jgi:hypothetical protein